MEILVPPEFQRLWEQNEAQPVIKYPAEVLRTYAEPVEKVTKRTKELVAKMVRAMGLAHGIGLAAPQLGVSERVIVVSLERRPMMAIINPVITHSEGEVIGEEGCLSLPGLYGEVLRKAIVEVEGQDIDGHEFTERLEGLDARVVQHEIDHLDGVLFIDKVDLATLHWAWPAGVASK